MNRLQKEDAFLDVTIVLFYIWVCGLSQDDSYMLVGQTYPLFGTSIWLLFCFMSGGSSIVSGVGTLLCPITIAACEKYLDLKSVVKVLYKRLVDLYTVLGLAIVVLTAIGTYYLSFLIFQRHCLNSFSQALFRQGLNPSLQNRTLQPGWRRGQGVRALCPSCVLRLQVQPEVWR